MTRRARVAIFSASVATSLAALAGCAGSPRHPNTIPAQELRINPRLAEGQRVFMQQCNQCHVGGASGVGPSLNDKHIPPFFVRFQVRHGLGAMPRFPESVISDAQLDDVVSYVRFLRDHPRDALRG